MADSNHKLQTSLFIGRHAETSKIGIFLSAQKCVLLDEIAPNYVSRYKPEEKTAHCRLEIYDDGELKLINLNPQNVTFAEGRPIEKVWIYPDTRIELGYGHYQLPLSTLLDKIKYQRPYDITRLGAIYSEYEEKIEGLQIKQAKDAAKQRLQGLISLTGVALGFIPGVPTAVRIICVCAALSIGAFFTIRSFQPGKSFQQQKKKIDLWLRDQFRCPACDKPFPKHQSYETLIIQGRCPFCHAKFITKN